MATTRATATDDAAIAIDKSVLLPGQTAGFANYTSYRAGINGLAIDIAGGATTAALSDFIFYVGNSDDPGTWQTRRRR